LLYGKRLLIEFYKSVFGQADLFGSEFKNPYLYVSPTGNTPSDKAGKLEIYSEWSNTLDKPDFRPSLVVMRGDGRIDLPGINKGTVNQISTAAEESIKMTFTSSVDLAVVAVERDENAVERLAALATVAMVLFRKTILKRSRILSFDAPAVGAIDIREGDGRVNQAAVRIMTSMSMDNTWKIREVDLPLLSEFDLDVSNPDTTEVTT
jgi:hypothetical protein